MISIKKYLDNEAPCLGSAEFAPYELLSTTLECYRSVLLAIGSSAVQGSSSLGESLKISLQELERRLADDPTSASVSQIEKQAEALLHEWGGRTAKHSKTAADEVKTLLIAIANAAQSLGDRDQRYSCQFKDLTVHLENIGTLDDLTQIRASLVTRVNELKESVDQMAYDSQQLVTQLRAEVSSYETRLQTAEHLVLKDALTCAASRHSAEERIHWSIANKEKFCVVMLDLNRFKQINDTYGHQAGDEVLKQFAMRLQLNTRSSDLVSRWGGDEFLVLLACTADEGRMHIQRIQKSVLGKYSILGGTGKNPVIVRVDASVGLAEWLDGQSMQELIAQADTAMYKNKRQSRHLELQRTDQAHP